MPEALFEQVGAVSEEVVTAMALGAQQRAGARFAVAVSGTHYACSQPSNRDPSRSTVSASSSSSCLFRACAVSFAWPTAMPSRVRA